MTAQEIIKFTRTNHGFASIEGRKIIENYPTELLREVVALNDKIIPMLITLRNNTEDFYLRKKILEILL